MLGRDRTSPQQPVSNIPPASSSAPSYTPQREYSPMAEKNMTIISQGTSFKGTLKSESSVQIDGDFEGDERLKIPFKSVNKRRLKPILPPEKYGLAGK